MSDTKICETCCEDRPLSLYRKRKLSEDGRGPVCKYCRDLRTRVVKWLNSGIENGQKVCGICLVPKFLDRFNKQKASADGHGIYCRQCNRDVTTKHYEENRNHVISRTRSYSIEHYDKVTERRLSNPERYNFYGMKWRLSNSEYEAERHKVYARNNPDKIRLNSAIQSGRRRTASRYTDITQEWLSDLRKSTPNCSLCSVRITENYKYDATHRNLDHIVPIVCGGGHYRRNVRYTCRVCNQRRPIDGSDEPEAMSRHYADAALEFQDLMSDGLF